MSVDVKWITIRVPPALHRRLHDTAVDQSVSLNALAVRALEACVENYRVDQERLPLRELGALLTPAVETTELAKEELLDHVRHVRRRIWQERYEKAVRAATE